MKENERYSSELQNLDASEGSLVINESENTE